MLRRNPVAQRSQCPKMPDSQREQQFLRAEHLVELHSAGLQKELRLGVFAGFEVLQAFHDHGVLELIRGLLGSGDQVAQIIVDAAKTPEAIRALRNLLILTKILGSIDPVLLEKFAQAMPEALESVPKGEQNQPPGFWGIVSIFRSANLRRGLAIVNNLLEAWGRNFSTGGGRTNS